MSLLVLVLLDLDSELLADAHLLVWYATLDSVFPLLDLFGDRFLICVGGNEPFCLFKRIDQSVNSLI